MTHYDMIVLYYTVEFSSLPLARQSRPSDAYGLLGDLVYMWVAIVSRLPKRCSGQGCLQSQRMARRSDVKVCSLSGEGR